MFVAASTHCFPELSFSQALEQATDLGFDRIELWISESDSQITPSDVYNDPDAFVHRYREATRLTPIAFWFNEDIDPMSFKNVCVAAKALRVAQITVPSLPLGTPFNEEIDRLKALTEIARVEGIQLSIKTQAGRLTEDPHTAVELCSSVKGLGLTYDPSYYVLNNQADKAADLVMPYVYQTHLRDTSPTELQVKTGLGEIDYAKLIAQLRKENYNRALTIDLLPEFTDKEDRGLEMRKLLRLLESML